MNRVVAGALAGLLFGAGLVISGMTRADKVINFLDLSDAWDPSLAFVMAGAIAVHAVLYRFILRRESPVFGLRFAVPSRSDIDLRLVGGAGLFGVGWGLGGYCPGPGLVASASLAVPPLTFLLGMTGGMLLFTLVDRPSGRNLSARADA